MIKPSKVILIMHTKMLEFYSQGRGFMSLQSFVMLFGTPGLQIMLC